ncbi:uncharacterized protein LOC109598897 [Aethina tumida]|uniref:uncharacterized protein LOC109598897 n=1 Tax=Aethina tumida TaxID=116153 RepID=UPI0021494648|nr:uncharacterized protein LOC109598897 [Aethina tumida]
MHYIRRQNLGSGWSRQTTNDEESDTKVASLLTAVCSDDVPSGLKFLQKVVDQCSTKEAMFKCLKIQALKIADRALHQRSLKLIDGVSLVSNERTGRTLYQNVKLNDTKLEKLDGDQIDDLLKDKSRRFLESRRLEVNFPKLVEEGRGKKKGGGYGALAWALAIKFSFLTMAYKGIAVMAGTALLVGKMALMLSAILGLKKLVSNQHHEKTTLEIIKQPKYSETHTHSTSYEDDGHYHRSYKDYDEPQSRIYKAYIPKH